MRTVLDGSAEVAIAPQLDALLTLVEKAARDASSITLEDVNNVRLMGWSDEAIYDAMTVCALFNFYTTWVDGTGVKGLSDYGPSAARLASEGYMP